MNIRQAVPVSQDFVNGFKIERPEEVETALNHRIFGTAFDDIGRIRKISGQWIRSCILPEAWSIITVPFYNKHVISIVH